MGISREVIPFPVRLPVHPDDWAGLQQLEQMINAHAESAGWPALSLHISLRDSRGEFETGSVAEARDSAVGRRRAVSALTMRFLADGGGHETSSVRIVEVRLEQSGPREVEIAGPDDIEVAGLARRIEELVRGIRRRGGPRRRRWRRLFDRLWANIALMSITIVSGLATTAILAWLGLS